MRTSLPIVRRLSPLFVSIALPLLPPCALRAQSTDGQTGSGQAGSPRPLYTTNAQVDYTGNLLGYYRMEPTEPTATLAPVKAFLDYRDADAKGPDGRHLLLGMGDDFGPEFGASLQLENTADPECAQAPKDTGDGETRPESLYKDDDRVPRQPQCDNVLNFLMHAGFRAVVPGRNDFMYTARWLRTATVRLARASEVDGGSPLIKNDDNQLYILAANLRIQFKGDLSLRHQETADSDAQQKENPDQRYSLNGRCPLLFSDDPFSPDSPQCAASGLAEPNDWLERLDSLSAGNGQNLTSVAMRQFATDASMTAAGRDSVLKLMVSDQLSILESAWGKRWTEVAALFKKPDSEEAKRGSHKATSGEMGDAQAGKASDLSTPGVARTLSGLQGLPQCKSDFRFADATQKADAADLCTYVAGLEHVLNEFSDELTATGADKTIPACKADDGTSSVGACFIITQQARQAATNGLLRTIAAEQKNVGYTVATQKSSDHKVLQRILVIGVVGQNTMKEVSETNLRMCIGLDGKAGKDDPNSAQAKENPDSVLDGVHWPGEFGICYLRTTQEVEQKGLSATAVATDPVVVAAQLVRAAELVEGRVNAVVLMAQMPHTEAEVLAARVWERLATSPAQQPINIVISEAGETETGTDASAQETGYDTPDMTLNYVYHAGNRNTVNTGHPPPVLTPFNGYPNPPDGRFPGAVSRATVQWTQGQKLVITNQSTGIYPANPPPQPAQGAATPASANTPATNVASTNTDSGSKTAIELLYELMAQIQGKPITYVDDSNNEQKAELALLVDLQQATQPFFKGLPEAGATRQHADVVLLQSRDVQLGAIGAGYQNYDMCNNELTDPEIKPADRPKSFKLCELRVALDRIFWKGDYLEYVAVKGQDIETILKQSDALIQQQNSLTETDTSQEWLVSYGIVQSSLSNPTLVNQNNEPLWIPVDPTCQGESAGKSTYCIAQTPIVDDAYYWLVTTDQLAEDRAVYGTLDALPSTNHVETETFITAPISHYLLGRLDNARLALDTTSLPKCPPPGTAVRQLDGGDGDPTQPCSVEQAITAHNESFQQRRLFQVDFAKLIAGFTARQPVGGNTKVENFQGVSNAQATAPASQDLDLETGSRILADLRVPDAASTPSGQNRFPWSVGLQSTFTYNRQVLGNLLGKPINASYSLNNWIEGAFAEVRLYGKAKGSQVRGVRSLPRTLLVLTPHQYQVEVDNPYLFFSFAATAPASNGRTELTVPLPRVTGWTDQAGIREEFGQTSKSALFFNGSYIQTGFEFSTLNSQLESITLQDGPTGTPKTCPVSAATTLSSCFTTANSNGPALTINGTTILSSPPLVKSLHTPGYYWQIHLQNRLPQFLGKSPDKQLSLVTDTTGDYYFGRPPSAELTSQTEYAIPLSVSLVFPSLGNLTFAPNYSAFFYKPQKSSESLIVNSWSLTARWYFARDARVPIRRQAPLKGPETSDQTKTGGH